MVKSVVKRGNGGQPKDLPWTVASLIRAFGGVNEFGRTIGVKQQAVSEMKRRGRISSKHWERILAEAAKLDFALRLRDLLAMQRPTEGSRRAAQKRPKPGTGRTAEPPA